MRHLVFFLAVPLAFAHPEPGAKPGDDPQTAVITGNGIWTYQAVPQWGELPNGKIIGPTHGGVVIDDETGLIYVSTNSELSMLVYQPDGKMLRAIAPECQGFHTMAIRKEDGKTVIYGAQLNDGRGPFRVCKIDTDGKILLEIPNAATGEVPGGWKGLTAVTVAPGGSIFAATGYGANMIHKFDAAGKLLKSFGGAGGDEKQFNTPHGLAMDSRFGEPRLLVADREKRRLVHFDLEGNWLGLHASNLRRPCAVSFSGDFTAVAELESRVTILDKTGTPVAFLGDNPNKSQWANFKVTPQDQRLGIFTAPHGLSFDKDGNLYVQDWNVTGRITKLSKLR
ncbi:MAG: 6-bladed beta-propeller [Gloeobacteraceae cyanobacterium ES-bin-144]|nr:6-bladed beta-propeller [Verrucomicrobiales bacterium]